MFSVYSPVTFYLVLSLCLLQSSCSHEDDLRRPGVTAWGDFIIGGLINIHSDVDKGNDSLYLQANYPCVRLRLTSLVRSLAMINAVQLMNKSPLLADVNVTLGYRIHDTCSDVSTALRAAADFIVQDQHLSDGNFSTSVSPIVAVVGASYSEMSIAVARQLTLSMIPQISFSSTAVILSDKNRFPSFMRTVPNDRHQTAAMVELLSILQWNWVGIVTMDGDYGQSALEHFVAQATERGICVAFRCILPSSMNHQDLDSEVKQCAVTIFDSHKVQVVVSFASPDHMSHLYQDLSSERRRQGKGSMKRVWLASDNWSYSSSVLGPLTLEDIGHIVGFTFKSGKLSSLFDYLKGLQMAGLEAAKNNPFLQEFYTLLNESGPFPPREFILKAMEILRRNSAPHTTFSIEMAVSAVAHAVASVCRRRDCKNIADILQPSEVLTALKMQTFDLWGKNYSFDSNGDINLGYDVTLWRSDLDTVHVHHIVAEYHMNQSFTHSNRTFPKLLQDLKHIVSRCSNSCVPGEFKKTAEGQHTCCYECIDCTENYFSNQTDMDQCLSCNTTVEWSPARSVSCRPKTQLFFSWQDVSAIVPLFFSALGILLALLVSFLFLHHRNTPVVKASGGPLSQVILYSLVVSFISPTLFVGRPNAIQCKLRHVLFGISFTLCVSCILVKTLKILLAFQFNPELQVILHRLYKPYFIVSACVALQVVICICWITLNGPTSQTIRGPTTLLEYCHEGSNLGFGFMLGYIALLASVCFLCAFKGRKLPQQYNEAKFITFSMLLYLISWMLFIPVYIKTDSQYLPAVEIIIIIISNYGVIACHFFPKCYIMLFRREQNTENAFRKNIYEYACKPTKVNSIQDSSASEQQTVSQQSSVTCLAVPCAAVTPTVSFMLKHCKCPKVRYRRMSI